MFLYNVRIKIQLKVLFAELERQFKLKVKFWDQSHPKKVLLNYSTSIHQHGYGHRTVALVSLDVKFFLVFLPLCLLLLTEMPIIFVYLCANNCSWNRESARLDGISHLPQLCTVVPSCMRYLAYQHSTHQLLVNPPGGAVVRLSHLLTYLPLLLLSTIDAKYGITVAALIFANILLPL